MSKGCPFGARFCFMKTGVLFFRCILLKNVLKTRFNLSVITADVQVIIHQITVS